MKLKTLLFSLLFVCATTVSFSQVLTFKVQTVTYGGSYNPDHALAVWITDASNKFVKTVARYGGGNSIPHLTNWIASTSAKSTVDATTGASLTSHPATPATYTWNCTNLSKVVVPDGTYYVNVEFVESNSTGKYGKYAFTIGAASTSTFPDVTNLKGVSYSTTISTQTPILEIQVSSKYGVCYNPGSKTVQINYDQQSHEQVMLSIMDLKGRALLKQSLTNTATVVNAAKLTKGAYLVKLTDSKGNTQSQKIVVR
ncbi:MAG: DUF2271 domain-containing protein [Bacteroidales bacterium]